MVWWPMMFDCWRNSECLCLCHGKGVMKRKLYFPFGWTESRLNHTVSVCRIPIENREYDRVHHNEMFHMELNHRPYYNMRYAVFVCWIRLDEFVAIGHHNSRVRFAWCMIILTGIYYICAVPTLLHFAQFVNQMLIKVVRCTIHSNQEKTIQMKSDDSLALSLARSLSLSFGVENSYSYESVLN